MSTLHPDHPNGDLEELRVDPIGLMRSTRAECGEVGTFNLAGPRWMTVEEMVGEFAKAINVRPPTLHAPRWMGLTVGWAAEQVSAVVGAEPPISRRTLAFFENDNAFDISAARGAFGFDPRTELEGGVRQAAANGA